MAVITLAQAKLHLRASTAVDSPNPEDDLINIYILAADDYIKNYLDRDVIPVKDAIKAAALLLVADLYENRNGAYEGEIKQNPAVERLLFPYRRNLGV
jgi:hypothetical protein